MKRLFPIYFFFFSLFSINMLIGCSESENDIIPDVYIDFTIDLLDPEFVGLTIIGVADTIDAFTNNWGSRSAGFDGNGIIVYSGSDRYFAYDRTCPYDYSTSGLSIKVKVDSMTGIAECPNCSTRYYLSTYGTPISGPGKYTLKNYNTSFDGERYVRVWNK